METGETSHIEVHNPSKELLRRSLEGANNDVSSSLAAINNAVIQKGGRKYSSFTALTASDRDFLSDPEMTKLFSSFRKAVSKHVGLMVDNVTKGRATRLRKAFPVLYMLAEGSGQGRAGGNTYSLEKQYLLSDINLTMLIGRKQTVDDFRHSQAMFYSDLCRKEGKVTVKSNI